jgi:hypothetical protein
MLTPRIAFCKAVLDDCTQSGAHLHHRDIIFLKMILRADCVT